MSLPAKRNYWHAAVTKNSWSVLRPDDKELQFSFVVSTQNNKCHWQWCNDKSVIGIIKILFVALGQARSLSFDLVDQYDGLENNGQFRFTPATHAMLAFSQALKELEQEGGVEGRGKRYEELCKGWTPMKFVIFFVAVIFCQSRQVPE